MGFIANIGLIREPLFAPTKMERAMDKEMETGIMKGLFIYLSRLAVLRSP